MGLQEKLEEKWFKKWFRTIIETIFPEGLRVGLQLIPNLNPEWNKEYAKLFEVPNSTAIAMLKSPPFHISDKYYYDHGISYEYRNHLAENKDIFITVKNNTSEIVHDLIRLRNKIFKIQDDYSTSKLSINNRPDLFKSADFRKMLQSSTVSNEDYGLSIFEWWNIKRKSEWTSDFDIYLTDYEI